MNKKEAVSVASVVLLTFVGGAFADTLSNTQTRTTVQTTGVDIEILQLVPGIAYGMPSSVNSGIIIIGSSTFYENLTSSFAFAPMKGFSGVNSVWLTLVLSGGNINPNDALSVRLNQGAYATINLVVTTLPQTEVMQLTTGNLRVGSNLIDVGVISGAPLATSSYQLFELRLTVDYSFAA